MKEIKEKPLKRVDFESERICRVLETEGKRWVFDEVCIVENSKTKLFYS